MSQIRKSSDSLIRIQRKIYASLKAEVTRLMGPTPPSILSYERVYRRAFQKLLKRPSLAQAALSQDDFLKELRDTDFVFVGDFHTDPQSQKTALRLLKKLQENHPQSEWGLGLEMIPSHYQRWIDRYLAGEISEEKFLTSIRYREEWGFPWEHYSPLFTWARESRIPILALNRPRALAARYRGTDRDPTHDLRARDQWAAGVLMDHWSAAPKHRRFLVLYGEMHVAQAHLPHAIRTIGRALGFGRRSQSPLPVSASVFSGFDALYFKWAELGKDSSSEILKIAPLTYCLMTSTPWGKLQSAINWLEGGQREETFSATAEEDDETEYVRDESGQITEPLRWLCDFFQIPTPPLDSLQLVTIRNADQMEAGLNHSILTRGERAALRYHWLHNQRVYCAPLTLAYLGSPSPNTFAEMAALHLLMSTRRRKRMLPDGDAGYYELIIDSCFGFLGSLLLNPKRKCDLARDHQRRLRTLKTDRASAPLFPEEIAMRELTLRTLKRIDDPLGPTLYNSKRLRERMTAILACRQVGKVLAKALYPAIREGTVTQAQLRSLFLERLHESADSRTVCTWLARRVHTQSQQTKSEHF